MFQSVRNIDMMNEYNYSNSYTTLHKLVPVNPSGRHVYRCQWHIFDGGETIAITIVSNCGVKFICNTCMSDMQMYSMHVYMPMYTLTLWTPCMQVNVCMHITVIDFYMHNVSK